LTHAKPAVAAGHDVTYHVLKPSSPVLTLLTVR
jgi:hypothetical protein